MSGAAIATSEIWIGDGAAAGRSGWLSPALLGLCAPIILGLLVAPQLLEGGAVVVWLLLGCLLVFAACAYTLSIVAPGDVCGVLVRPQSREVAIVRKGPAGRSEIRLPFAEVGRLASVVRYDQDGYELPAIEVRTRAGDSWIVAAEVAASELAQMRRVIGLREPLQGPAPRR